jgi:hypothetical protein
MIQPIAENDEMKINEARSMKQNENAWKMEIIEINLDEYYNKKKNKENEIIFSTEILYKKFETVEKFRVKKILFHRIRWSVT